MRKYIFGWIYGVILAAFTLYLILDTFVIVRVYQVVQPPQFSWESSADASENSEESEETSIADSSEESSIDSSEEASDADSTEDTSDADSSEDTTSTTVSEDTTSTSEPDDTSEPEPHIDLGKVISEETYSDGDITITLREYRKFDTAIYAAEVTLSSAEYLKTAFAKNSYGKNIKEKTSDIANNNGAIFAINGDFYGARENGFVLRNGVLYRTSADRGREALVINMDGSFKIVRETKSDAEKLAAEGAWQIFTFGPGLVEYGEVVVDSGDEVALAMRSNPRTAIGQIGDLHYVFVVSDGRTEESDGLSLKELAQVMQALGAKTAYNMDGGGSSTMYFNGRIVNNPTFDGSSISERKVSDIVFIGK